LAHFCEIRSLTDTSWAMIGRKLIQFPSLNPPGEEKECDLRTDHAPKSVRPRSNPVGIIEK
jgi:hypothetical protein